MVEHATSCENVWREISNYIDGEVDAAQRASMDEHFKSCARCASVLAGTKNVVALYGDERMLEVPAGFGQRLEKRLEKRLATGAAGTSSRESSRTTASVWSSLSAWLIPLAAMVLIAGGMMLTSSLTHGRFFKSQHAEPANHIPPDLVVVVSSGAKLFHVAGCPFIHDKATERTLTAKEAMQEGYVPCTRCLRQYLKTSVMGSLGLEVAEAEQDEEHEEALSAAAR